MNDIFRDTVINGGEKIGLSFSKDTLNKFEIYFNMLIKENKKYNLTSIIEPSEVAEKHFIDSLILYNEMDDLYGKKILDIGSGAGFPGLPIKIYNPGIYLTLVDAVSKKVFFLQNIINKLKLKDVEAIQARAEEFALKHRERYDFVVSRAVAELRVLVEYALPIVKVGGFFIAAKGPNVHNELKAAENAISILGGQVQYIKEISLPLSKEGRSIIVIKKNNETPIKYPRRTGIPKKRPL